MPMTANGLAKLLEETSELGQVGAKRLAYFTTLMHPDGVGDLKTRMEEEIADVEASTEFVKGTFELDREAIARRAALKLALFQKWHADPSNGAESYHAARDEERQIEERARREAAAARRPPAPAGFALVPLVPNAAMERVMRQPQWTLADLLAAAGAVGDVECAAQQDAEAQGVRHFPEEWGPSSSRRLTCSCGNADPGHLDNARAVQRQGPLAAS